MLSTEIFHPSNVLWYLASICPRTSQDRWCNSNSKPRRLSFNIMMISKLLRLIRTSSNSGTSHSRSTICVCSNLMTPCNFSISISRPMSWSFSASYTALSLDLSPGSHLRQNISKFLDTQTSRFQTGYSGFKFSKQVNFYKNSTHSSVSKQVPHCPNTSLVSPGPTPNLSLFKSLTHFSLRISRQVYNFDGCRPLSTSSFPTAEPMWHAFWTSLLEALETDHQESVQKHLLQENLAWDVLDVS